MQPLGYLGIFAGALLLVAALKGSSIQSVAKGAPDHKYGDPLGTTGSAAGGGTSNTAGEPAGSAASVAGPGSSTTRRAAVTQAAHAHGIPAGILWGVFGAESSWGRGGTNWFGLTSVPRAGSFVGDANRSAETLARLWREHGHNWDLALKAYSGGSYGYEHVAALSKGG